MKPRERVLAILNRQPVDRIPVDLWRTPEIHDALCQYTGATDERGVYLALGIDKIYWFPAKYDGPVRSSPQNDIVYNPWGCGLKVVQAGPAQYEEYCDRPLHGYDSIESLDDFPWWPKADLFDIDGMVAETNSWARDFAVMGPWVSHFEIYCAMRGLEQALMDLLVDPDYVQAALDRIEAIQTQMLEAFLPRVAGTLSLVFVSDDMGSQDNLLMSRETWREFFGPRLKRWCDLIHRHGAKVFFHTDGAVRPLIPDLIKAGIDVLNPIQHACQGMDMEGLKRDFGDRLIFHGGVDNQQVLPFGTPDDVRAETRRCLQQLGSDGAGYICASCHRIQPDTRVANIIAMVETVLESRTAV